jgi:hypothetical protein
MLARIESAHHFLRIGEIFLNEPVALKRNVAALVMDAIADVVDMTFEPNGFSVKSGESVFADSHFLSSKRFVD